MNPGTLQTVCQVAILVCVIVAALATYGSFHYGRKKKDNRAKAATKLNQGNAQLNPGTLQTVCQMTILVCVIVGALATYGSFHYGHKEDDDERAKAATVGTIGSAENAVERKLAIGGIKIVLTSSNNDIVSDSGDPLLSLKIENEKLYIKATIRSDTGEVIAVMEDNQWQLNKNNYFDRNYTDDAIEVKNQLGNVVLQVVDFGNVIHFAGVFHAKDGHVVSFLPFEGLSAAIEIRDSENELQLKIKPIFDYPSELHFGSCPGKLALQQVVEQGQSRFNFSGSIDISTYSKEMEKIIRLL